MRYKIFFEEALTLINELPPPDDAKSRTCKSVPGAADLAVAKTKEHIYELLFIGKKLEPRSSIIRTCLTYTKWQDDADKKTFEANSFKIPESHYSASIAALIIVEFNRLAENLGFEEKFFALEPIIERFLQREMLTEHETIGLLGELIVLKEVISQVPPARYKATLDGWMGHRHVARDFTFGDTSLEIKTTQSTESIHTINSVGQIEARTDVNRVPVERLYLLSIGLIRSSSEGGHSATSLAETCDAILRILGVHPTEATNLSETFLSRVSAYGTSESRRYLHTEMRGHFFASQPWSVTFTRIYDMSDPHLSLPRREELNIFRDVVTDSFSFEISLPRRVSGDLNPLYDLPGFISKLHATPVDG